MKTEFELHCVLFDLDGTLVDTAPDLVACLNRAIGKHAFAALSIEQIRPFISYGSTAMIEQAARSATPELKMAIQADMLDDYQNHIATHSDFFAGMPETLQVIESLGLKWGVVTNKLARFTEPLMAEMNLNQRAACIVSGDTTSYSKPHPEPMLTACRQARVKPENCAYIGDARHDIMAGNNTQMKTLAALYGYLKPDDQPETWEADVLINSPKQLTSWIQTTQTSCH